VVSFYLAVLWQAGSRNTTYASGTHLTTLQPRQIAHPPGCHVCLACGNRQAGAVPGLARAAPTEEPKKVSRLSPPSHFDVLA
jgi:hypothetical protein